jgi:hypothetical protein
MKNINFSKRKGRKLHLPAASLASKRKACAARMRWCATVLTVVVL